MSPFSAVQYAVAEMATALRKNGVEVRFGIHPGES